MTLALVVRSQELGNRKVKFGARVQQAKSLCSSRADCQFGYTFDGQLKDNVIPGSEGSNFREIVFVPPTASPENTARRRENQRSRSEITLDNQNNSPKTKETPSRRRLRLNIDPRRRTQQNRVDSTRKPNRNPGTTNRARQLPAENISRTNRKEPSVDIKKQLKNRKVTKQRSFDLFDTNAPGKLFEAFPEDENTVTINIGGTEIVIPDFDLSPRVQEESFGSIHTQNRNGSPNTSNPTQNLPNRQNQRRNKVRPRNQGQRESQGNQRKKTVFQVTSPRTTTARTTTPSTFSTTLASFNSLLKSTESFRSFDNFPSPPQAVIPDALLRKLNRKQNQNTQVSRNQFTTTETTTRKPRITPRRRNQPKVTRNPSQVQRSKAPKRPPPRSNIPNPRDPQSDGTGICPGSLEACVDTCVPLEDIYAYSSCVVECGERC